jgi:class 3 adenylate cyclase
MPFRERQLVTVMVDLARFTHAVAGMDSFAVADLIDRFYTAASTTIAEHGGRVVKYLGDGCLAVFPSDRAVDALDCVEGLSLLVNELGTTLDGDLELGANIHLCTVAEGEFGTEGVSDIVGAGVIHTFRMGSGPGVRISEPVYRKLPSARRSPWVKYQPPATYRKVSG